MTILFLYMPSQVPDEVDLTNNMKTDGVVTLALYELLVRVVDELINPIPNAIVKIVGQTQSPTNINGEAHFLLSKDIYQVQASKGALHNNATVNLEKDTVLTISLIAPPILVGGETYSIDSAATTLRQVVHLTVLASVMILYAVRKKAKPSSPVLRPTL